jgi:hypothetical protein
MLLLDHVCDNLPTKIEFDPYVPLTITWGDEVSGLDFWSPRAKGHDTIVEVRRSRADGTLRELVLSNLTDLTDMRADDIREVDHAEQGHPVLRPEGITNGGQEHWYERETVPNLDVAVTPAGTLLVRWSINPAQKALVTERLKLLFDEEQIFVGFVLSELTADELALLRDAC